MTSRIHSPLHLVGLMLLALLLCTGSNCTGDPPGITNVRLAVNRSGVRAGFTLVDFKIQSVQVFYDDAPPPMPTNAGLAEDCSFAPAELAAENLGLASLDLTEKGLTGIGSFQTRFGKVTEIRLVIDQPALTREGSRGELKGQLACKGDAQPSRREVLRLIPAAPIQLAATTVTLAVDFDPNRDVFTGEVGRRMAVKDKASPVLVRTATGLRTSCFPHAPAYDSRAPTPSAPSRLRAISSFPIRSSFGSTTSQRRASSSQQSRTMTRRSLPNGDRAASTC
jgi:hypothetical protein